MSADKEREAFERWYEKDGWMYGAKSDVQEVWNEARRVLIESMEPDWYGVRYSGMSYCTEIYPDKDRAEKGAQDAGCGAVVVGLAIIPEVGK